MTVIPHFADPVCVPDVYAERLSVVEYIGSGVMRFTFTTKIGGEEVVVARVLMEEAAVRPAILHATKIMADHQQKLEIRDVH